MIKPGGDMSKSMDSLETLFFVCGCVGALEEKSHKITKQKIYKINIPIL